MTSPWQRSRHYGRTSSAVMCMALSPIWVPFSAELIYDSQLRWLGPEKGVMHMAIGAVVNAAWVLTAKHQAIITGGQIPSGRP